MAEQGLNRRDFARRSFQVVAGGALVGLVAQACGGPNSTAGNDPGGSTSGVTLDLSTSAYAALQQPGGAVRLVANGTKLIVYRVDTTTFVAVSAVCTHAGCELPVPASGVITCRCHGSKFDTSGKVLKGPATDDLRQVTATLSGSILTLAV